MPAGIFWDGLNVSSADRILTWQDEGALRFWISSVRNENDLHEIVSVDVVRRESRSRPPTDAEARNRFAVMPRSVTPRRDDEDLLAATRIKALPWAVVLLERAGLVTEEMSNAASPPRDQLHLVSTRQRIGKGSRSPRKQTKRKLSTTNADSILIAKVYADLVRISRAKIGQRTAEYLGIPVDTVHGALRVARRNGWLTSAGYGKAGGTLTAEGLLAFASADGPSRLAEMGLPVEHGRG